MSIKRLMGASSFYMINKTLLKEVGLTAALMLDVMINAESVFGENGWFFQTVENVKQETGIGERGQKDAINKLIELGLIQQKNIGMPARRHFRLNEQAILDLILKEKIEKGVEDAEFCAESVTDNATDKSVEKVKAKPKAFGDADFKRGLIEAGGEEKLVNEWLGVRKKKGGVNTESALDSVLEEFRKAALVGYDINQCIKLCNIEGWRGFKKNFIDKYLPQENSNQPKKSGFMSKGEAFDASYHAHMARIRANNQNNQGSDDLDSLPFLM